MTREAMLHLGIDTLTQNNIFKVRRKAMALTFDRGHWKSPLNLSLPENLRLWALPCSFQEVDRSSVPLNLDTVSGGRGVEHIVLYIKQHRER